MRTFLPVATLILAALALTLIPLHGVAADLKAGQVSYERACKLCHGPDGKGVAAIFKALQAPTMTDITAKTEDELKVAIKDGKGKMPPVQPAQLPEKEKADLIAYVHSLKK
jgi:cytochrome c oxidase cbb3-type subunit III